MGMISVKQLGFQYPGNLPLFQNFSWEVEEGETWAILGASGCGKTSLLYLLAGLRKPNLGEILIQGEELIRPRPSTGLILQDYGLLPWATVEENVALGYQVRQFYGADGIHAPVISAENYSAKEWMERLGILENAKQYPSQLSGGQRQRTAIARTFSLEPDLLLMDEPFSSLDAVTREDLQTLTLSLSTERNITAVIVTHSIEEAAILGKKILLLAKPPNTKPVIISNPNSGSMDYKKSAEYQNVCLELRERMDEA